MAPHVLTLVVCFQACPEGHFLCSTGLCVEKFRRCDGLDDCQDESDEIFCCTLTTKSCKPSSSTIVKHQNVVNIHHFIISYLYPTAKPPKICGGSSPLHPLYICNGNMDCASGKDETNCTQGNVRIIKNSHFQMCWLYVQWLMCWLCRD